MIHIGMHRREPERKGTVVANTADGGELWTTGQAADYLARWGITRRTVSRMINSGALGGYRREPGKWGRVPSTVVEQYGRHLDEQAAARRRAADATAEA